MKKELLIIEQYFYPDGWSGTQYPINIAEKLISEGWKVKVLCGDKPYINKNFYEGDPREKGIMIDYIKLPFNQKKIFFKLINHIIFSLISFIKITLGRKPKLIVVFTNPPPIITIVFLIKIIFKIPYVIVAMDLYPEVLLNNLSKNKSYLFDKILSPLFDISYRSANKIVSLGEAMSFKLNNKGIKMSKISIIRNWAIGNLEIKKAPNELSKKWNIKSKVTLLYSGNLGVAHEWETLLEALKISKLKPNELTILFVTSGERIEKAKIYAKNNLYDNSVIFKPLVQSQYLPLTMGLADLAVVTLRSSFDGLVSPSKFSGYLGRGLPVLFIGLDSEIKKTIELNDLGASFSPGSTEALADYLKFIYKNPINLKYQGKNSLNFYNDNLSKEKSLSSYAKLINKLFQKIYS